MSITYIRDKRLIVECKDGAPQAVLVLPSVSQAKRYNRQELDGKAQKGSVKIPPTVQQAEVVCPRGGK